MSKNVAVFVDVANIFYAAKAAGVDIDYVTLLKAATAGRDFVRAYAYTGLDPENENQRQFHSFLARNGYKVISKDIRKYGDGRIKANLDIELVVDMMRMARNLDIAVVVSGDGDFAPAIRAVQQMGVRVDVISFRGNTSSDLMDVADTFIDIAQIARVDKGSARSGRRVASEGDLSMTEVPEKETEGAPRRRRGRARDDRPAAVAEPAGLPSAGLPAAGLPAVGLPGNLIVLPGERLSRTGELDEEEVAGTEPVGAEVNESDLNGAEPQSADGTPEDQLGEEARRRRRRRGGRGRGRGRRAETEAPVVQPGVAADAGPLADEEDEKFEEVGPAQLPHQTFGSVWDSQLGVAPSLVNAAGGSTDTYEEEEDLDEPEIPEYLLAERRQRGQGCQDGRGGQRGRMPGRGGRAGGGYQAALDRERYGRGGSSGGFRPQPNVADRPRQDRPPRGGRQQRPGRPQDRPPRDAGQGARPPQAQRSSGDPWSEVPPELEDMLRAELARKSGGPAPSMASTEAPASTMTETLPEPQAQPERRPTRRRTAKVDTAPEPAAPSDSFAASDQPAEASAPKPQTRRRTAKSTADAASAGGSEAEAKPKRATRARTKATIDAASAEASPETGSSEAAAGAPDAPAKPARRRRTAATKES